MSAGGAPAGGERSTRQRAAIRDALARAGRPLAPSEIFDAARVHVPQLGIATVYRTLKSLAEEGVAHAVELPGEPARWELTGKRHHHHFHCRSCGGVFDAPGCVGGMEALVPSGFVLERHEIVLYGRCPDCVGLRNG